MLRRSPMRKVLSSRLGILVTAVLVLAMLAGGSQLVPPFELLEATHKKVVDGAHSWAAYWVGKNKTAVLFTGGPGGTYGMDFIDYIGWMYEGGGWVLYQEFYRDVLKVNVIPIPIMPAGP